LARRAVGNVFIMDLKYNLFLQSTWLWSRLSVAEPLVSFDIAFSIRTASAFNELIIRCKRNTGITVHKTVTRLGKVHRS
jgi:hypothetical protein